SRYFGESVDIDNNSIIVGAPDGFHYAYLFLRNSFGDWTQQDKFSLSGGGGGFGLSVGISNNTVIVGAYQDGDNGSNIGAAYTFSHQPFTRQEKLVADDGAAGDSFGGSVAIHGQTAIVGAYGDDNGPSDSGSAYVFVRNAIGDWIQEAKLLPNDFPWIQDYFGMSVAIHGETAIVGKYGDDSAIGYSSGSAYVFVRNASGNWNQQAKLIASDGAAYDWFGWSVAIHGDTAIVGAIGDDDNVSDSGSVYVFVRDATTNNWNQQAKLVASDGERWDYLGWSISIHGDTAIAG
ncbi:hypothetical protein ACHAXR_000455, partial [Thalassiosira sp. AJA248-18]